MSACKMYYISEIISCMVSIQLAQVTSMIWWAYYHLVGLPLLGGSSTTCWWAFYYMLGLLLLTECGSCKKDVAATHPVSQDPACDQTDHHQRHHCILLAPDVQFPNAPDQTHNHQIAITVHFRPNQHYHQHHHLDLNTSERN